MTAKSWLPFVTLSALLGCLVVGVLGHSSAELLVGTDERAERVIRELHPGYRRWCVPWFVPSRSTERVLFGLQAVLGVSLVAYSIVTYRRLGAQRQRHAPSD